MAFSMWCTGSPRTRSLFDHYPSWFQNWKGNQANDSCGRNQRGIANLPTEKNSKRRDANEHCQPVADGNFPKQNTGADNSADGSRIGAFDKSLNVGIAAVTREERCCNQDEDKRRKEYADGGNKRAPKSSDQIANKRRGDDHGSGADHADSNGDKKLPLIEPVVLLDKSLLQEWHDHEAAAEGERARLEKKQKQFSQCRT